MAKKSPKRFKIVKTYLLKILDRSHHDFFNFSLSNLSPEKLHDLYHGKLDLEDLEQRGHVQTERKNDWDSVIEAIGRENTPELIKRDIRVVKAIKEKKIEEKISTEKAIEKLIAKWPSEKLGAHLGIEALKEIYKNYGPTFNSNRDAAISALREQTALTGRYPIEKPTGILERLHRILELPFEEDIFKEIAIYRTIRNSAFGITYLDSRSLVNRSIGRLQGRFESRPQKIQAAIKNAMERFNYSFDALVSLYCDYRMIEAEANRQNTRKIRDQLQEDLKFSN
jgi:hypothetical protein